jgi:hypothetical protein
LANVRVFKELMRMRVKKEDEGKKRVESRTSVMKNAIALPENGSAIVGHH